MQVASAAHRHARTRGCQVTTFGNWVDTQSGAPGTLGQVSGVWKSSRGTRPKVSSVEKVTEWVTATMVEQGADRAAITAALYQLAENWRAAESRARAPAAPPPSEPASGDAALLPALFARLGRMEGQLAECLAVLRPLGELLTAADAATDAHLAAQDHAEQLGWLGDGEPAAPAPPAPVTFYGAAQAAWWTAVADAATTPPGGDAA